MTPIRVKLRELRKARGLTQQQLAEAAGVHQGTISEMETGQTGGIDFAVLDRLCVALGVDVGELLEREEPKRKRGR